MNYQTKQDVVAALKERLDRASIMILAEPRGLSVAEVTDLRNKIRAQEGEYKIAKNSLTQRAVDETGYAAVAPLLKGQTALVFGYGDAVAVTKELVNNVKDLDEKLEIRGAVMDGEFMDQAQVAQLAKLESMEQLRGKLVGVLAAPASKLVRLLNEPGGAFARVLNARGESGAPAAE